MSGLKALTRNEIEVRLAAAIEDSLPKWKEQWNFEPRIRAQWCDDFADFIHVKTEALRYDIERYHADPQGPR
jgi:hypothetical protein